MFKVLEYVEKSQRNTRASVLLFFRECGWRGTEGGLLLPQICSERVSLPQLPSSQPVSAASCLT